MSVALELLQRVTRQLHMAPSLIELREVRSAKERVLRRLQLRADGSGALVIEGRLLDVAAEPCLTHEAYYRTLAALAFASGDYADPAAIHGRAMPGLAEPKIGASRVRVLFEDRLNGTRMHFSTQDPALVAALHRWFEAQVWDHGADAVMQR